MAKFAIKDLKQNKFKDDSFEEVERRDNNDAAHDRLREMKESGEVSDKGIVVLEPDAV